MFWQCKIALPWLFSAVSWSSVFFTLELQNEVVQNRMDVLVWVRGPGRECGDSRCTDFAGKAGLIVDAHIL